MKTTTNMRVCMRVGVKKLKPSPRSKYSTVRIPKNTPCNRNAVSVSNSGVSAAAERFRHRTATLIREHTVTAAETKITRVTIWSSISV